MTLLDFAIEPLEPSSIALAITPVLDGIRLTQMIEEFERERGYEPAGGYAGIVPAHFKFGPLDQYFLAATGKDYFEVGGHYVLGCTCGEVGCWPLNAKISVSHDSVVWDRFRQPHRPDRNYSGFGPFTFKFEQYSQAIAELASRFPKSQIHQD